MGSTPLTLRTAPSKANSPRNAVSGGGGGSWPDAARMDSSTGRSYTGPVFLMSAGARFTVMRLTG